MNFRHFMDKFRSSQTKVNPKWRIAYTGKVSDLLDTPEQSILLAGVLLVSFFSFTVSQTHLSAYQSTQPGQVLGVAEVDTELQQEQLAVTYQGRLVSQLNSYLKQRQDYLVALEAGTLSAIDQAQWLAATNFVKQNILDMLVPGSYRDLHLKLVVLLSEEYNSILALPTKTGMTELNQKWQRLLSQYSWLVN